MTECAKCGRTLPPPYKQTLALGEKVLCATCGPNSRVLRVDEDEYPPSDAITDHTSTKDDWRDHFFALGVSYEPAEPSISDDAQEVSADLETDESLSGHAVYRIKPNLQSKYDKAIRFAVLLAYYFGRRFHDIKRHAEVRRAVEPVFNRLQNHGSPKILIRTAFYYAVLAETHRFQNPAEYRRKFLEVSLKIEQMGLEAPFELYKSILEVTTTRNKVSYFGSHVVKGSDYNPVLFSDISIKLFDLPTYDAAARAAGLTVQEYQEFLSKYGRLSLHEIMARHRLV